LTTNSYALKPLKAKSLIGDVAGELGVAEDVVDTVVSYYWQEVRKQLSSLSHHRVHVTNLGDFTVKHWKLDEKIALLQMREENNSQKGVQHLTSLFRITEQLYDLNHLKAKLLEESQRAEFVRLHKRTMYEQSGKHNSNLESKRSDT